MGDNQFDVGTNFGESMPGMPIDANHRPPAVLMGAIVEDGAIVKYLPIRCKDNGDGSCTPYVDTSG